MKDRKDKKRMGNKKRPKVPTLKQKIMIGDAGLKWENWHVLYMDFETLMLQNKQSGKTRAIRR